MGGKTTKEMRDKWRRKMMEQNRCISCGRPTGIDKLRCEFHREKHLMRQRAYNERRRKKK